MQLGELRQWMLWKMEGGRKVPCTIHLQPSGSTTSDDYVTLREAECSPSFRFSQGLAFCFVDGGGLVGIDLDNCVVDGRLKDWARPILDRFRRTYIELSPSLTGVKIYTAGVLPAGVVSSVVVADGAVEMWSSGRFFAYTQIHIDGTGDEAVDCQEAIDWLIDEYGFGVPQQPTTATSTVVPSQAGLSSVGTLNRRLADYAARCQRVTEGQRNESIYRAACSMFDFEHHGEIPTLEAVTAACQTIAAGFLPPLPPDEVAEAVASAEVHRQDRPAKPALERPAPQVVPGIDISRLTQRNGSGSRPAVAAVKTRPSLPAFPRSAIEAPGFIATFVDWCLRTSMYPQPQLAVAAGLGLLAAVTGRKIANDAGSLRTNIYILGVAPAGSGKEHSRRCVKQLVAAAERTDYVGPERLVSSAGLVTVVKKYKSILLMIDEIGKLLATMQDKRNVHLYAIGGVMLQIYTSSDILWVGDAYADEKKTPKIQEPNLCIFGTTTGSSLWPKLSLDNVSDGMLPRMCLVEGEYVDPVEPEDIPPPQTLVDYIHTWDAEGDLETVHPNAVRVPHDADAKQRLFSHAKAITMRCKSEDPYRSAIWVRTAEKSKKLALLFAASRVDGGPKDVHVTKVDADRGIELANWMTRRLIDRVAGYHVNATNQVEKEVMLVLAVIRSNSPISRRDLTRKTQGIRRRDREEILNGLVESGEIDVINTTVEVGNGAMKPVQMFASL